MQIGNPEDVSHYITNATYVYEVLLVPQSNVVQDGCFVEVRERGHVLHTFDAGLVHWSDVLVRAYFLGILQCL